VGIFRSYFNKTNTIISDSTINTARNEVTELSYGNVLFNLNNFSTGSTIYTRYLIGIDFDNLKEKVDKGYVSIDDNTKHKIFLYNTIKLKDELTGQNLKDNSKRSQDITLKLYKIHQDWTQGNGHDFIYNNTIVGNLRDNSINPSNWFNAKKNEPWVTAGAISGTTSGDTIIQLIDPIGEQYFELGNEHLEIDITEDINSYLNGESENYGYILAYDTILEDTHDDYLNKIHFFSKYTNTFFEPFLKTEFDNTISDSSNKFLLDTNNRLYIRTKKTPDKLIIYNDCEELILVITDIKRQNGNYYYGNINLSSEDHSDFTNYEYKWYENEKLIKEDTFTLYNQEYFDNLDTGKGNLYDLNLLNINYNETLEQNELRNLIIDVKNFYNSNDNVDVYYNMYILERNYTKIEVIPDTKVSKFDGKYFFTLDTSWLIPQQYNIDIYIKEKDGDFKLSKNKTIKFSIFNKKV